MKRIIVDMMGGDNAPLETVKGVCLAAEEIEAEFVLVGNKEELLRVAEENELSLDGFEIVHTEGVITMEDEPISVVRTKADSSMGVGLKMLAEGRGDAFVSTGNTGALYTGSCLIVRKIKGARRPAIGAVLPMHPPVLLLDSGANIDVTPEYMEQFAVMGSVFANKIMGLEEPRVGLLNNGAEAHKGTPLQIDTYKLLSENGYIKFVGNVEGNQVMRDYCDVLVTDGFTGNILLKTMEGMGSLALHTLKDLFTEDIATKTAYLLVRSHVGDIKKNFDSAEFGGSPILGIAKPVIKAHGSSKAKAFKNAIRQAVEFSNADLNKDLESSLAELAQFRKEKKNEEK